jgi:hypothetical protein
MQPNNVVASHFLGRKFYSFEFCCNFQVWFFTTYKGMQPNIIVAPYFLRSHCNLKRRELLLAHSTSTTYNVPMAPDLILIYSTYTDLQSSWHSDCLLTLASAHYRSWTYNTQQDDRPHNTPAPASLIHTQMPATDTFILHYKLCTLRKHKFSFYQML